MIFEEFAINELMRISASLTRIRLWGVWVELAFIIIFLWLGYLTWWKKQ